jgi:hypothetical protein
MPNVVPAYLPLALPPDYRRITRPEFSFAFAADQESDAKRIGQAGFLLGILLTFEGTLTSPNATVPVLDSEAPYRILKNVELSVSNGVGRSINLDGYALNIVERLREPNYTDNPVVPVVANAANAWKFSVHVPVCVRDGDLYGGWSDYLGGIWAGDADLDITLKVKWGNLSDIITNQNAAACTLVGTLNVVTLKKDTPAPDEDAGILAAISWTHQVQQTQVNIPVNSAGEMSNVNALSASQARAYLRIWDIWRNNGVDTDALVESYDSDLQSFVDFFQNIPAYAIKEMMRRRYQGDPTTQPIPAGVYVPIDFAAGNTRNQWLPVDRITEFKLKPTVAAGVALTNAQLNRYAESVVPSPLAADWVQRAAKNGLLDKLMGGSQQRAA